MSAPDALTVQQLEQQLSEAEATISALLSGQVDAVIDSRSNTPVLLSMAQEALRNSEERYRLIVETTSEGISILDADSRFAFVNRRLAEMFRYPPDELLGMSMFEMVPESGRATAMQQLEQSHRGIPEENEVEYVRKDRAELWALVKTIPIRDADGTWHGTLAVLTDRTNARRAEEALRDSEEQYRQIVEATNNGLLRLADDGQIVFVNGRLAQMLGYDPLEMIGSSVFDFMSLAARAGGKMTLESRTRGVTDAMDTALRHRNGAEISVNVVGTPLLDRDGVRVGTLAVIRDVTEQRRLQSQLLVSDRMASVGTLAAGVAHEINNPLAAVIANLEFVMETLGPKVTDDSVPLGSQGGYPDVLDLIREPLDDARDASERVRLIVRDLKIFSRSPSDEPRRSVDVEATMESSLRMGWNEIRHRARLVKHYGGVPGVEANEARLGQVFLNLIVNAAHAIPEGHAEDNEIVVRTAVDLERVSIEVSDTGSGIPPTIIDRIFNAFFTTKEVGVGNGLGLAICQRIITDMGGELTVRSEVGLGSTFRVSLPIAVAGEIEAVAVEHPVPLVGRRGRILVVDDDELVGRTVQRTLASEHDVVAIAAARDALALCATGERFDLILCDLMMPDMTGMDLQRELSRAAPDQAGRMIFLTGGAFTVNARHFLSDRPKDYLEKPFDPANLRAIVHRYLQ